MKNRMKTIQFAALRIIFWHVHIPWNFDLHKCFGWLLLKRIGVVAYQASHGHFFDLGQLIWREWAGIYLRCVLIKVSVALAELWELISYDIAKRWSYQPIATSCLDQAAQPQINVVRMLVDTVQFGASLNNAHVAYESHGAES